MDIRTRNIVLVSAGFVLGAGTGYFVGQTRAAAKYELIIDEEIASIKKVYGQVSVGLVKPPLEEVAAELLGDVAVYDNDLEEVVGEYNDAIKDLEYGTPLRSDEEIKNIFSEPQLDDDEVGPILHRNPAHPYQISLEEYMTDHETQEKVSMVYYEEDDVLTDDQESILTDVDTIVGIENLHSFEGDVQYVRNERLELDIEIIRNHNSYTSVVMGVKEEKPVRPKRPKKSTQRDE
jgi:hypothetical protein